MPIIISRVDERLVHGQIITSWTKQLRIDKIYIIDDAISNDEFMTEVLLLSAPTGLTFEILSVNDANELLAKEDSMRIMLLFKSIGSALKLKNAGYNLKDLNLGNVASSANRKKITKNVSLSEMEVEQIHELVDSGVEVYFQMLYTDSKINVLEQI